MPISVELKVNGHLIDIVHIGRLSGNTRPDSVNEYSVLRSSDLPSRGFNASTGRHIHPEPQTVEEWVEVGVKFEHVYGDGLETCVMKGLAALQEAEAGKP